MWRNTKPGIVFAHGIWALLALTVLGSGVATHLSAQSAGHATTAAKPTIVLVHGAWADASGWYDVTLALQAHGYKVMAAQKPPFSPSKKIQTTKSVPDSPHGALVPGGHSYGGALITAGPAGKPHAQTILLVAGV